ncbi:hypothetical protein AB1Y20_015414 [Prymnesium parvum]|uniref:Uncharacterized protein n=1 Tax=Prymnesium parvum TaxID=97485 RepID=A0AB34K051_PRYPA
MRRWDFVAAYLQGSLEDGEVISGRRWAVGGAAPAVRPALGRRWAPRRRPEAGAGAALRRPEAGAGAALGAAAPAGGRPWAALRRPEAGAGTALGAGAALGAAAPAGGRRWGGTGRWAPLPVVAPQCPVRHCLHYG